MKRMKTWNPSSSKVHHETMQPASALSETFNRGSQCETEWPFDTFWTCSDMESETHCCDSPCNICSDGFKFPFPFPEQENWNNLGHEIEMTGGSGTTNLRDVAECDITNTDSHLECWDTNVHSSSKEDFDVSGRFSDVPEYASGILEQHLVHEPSIHSFSTHRDGDQNATTENSMVKPLSLGMKVKPRVRRRKFGQGDKHSLGGRPIHVVGETYLMPVDVTPEALRACFGKPLWQAAMSLGICATALKKICRKMGINEWPFQRIKPVQKRLDKLQSSDPTPDVLREIRELQTRKLHLLEGRDLWCFSQTPSVPHVTTAHARHDVTAAFVCDDDVSDDGESGSKGDPES